MLSSINPSPLYASASLNSYSFTSMSPLDSRFRSEVSTFRKFTLDPSISLCRLRISPLWDLNTIKEGLQLSIYQPSHQWYHKDAFFVPMMGKVKRHKYKSGKRKHNKCQQGRVWETWGVGGNTPILTARNDERNVWKMGNELNYNDLRLQSIVRPRWSVILHGFTVSTINVNNTWSVPLKYGTWLPATPEALRLNRIRHKNLWYSINGWQQLCCFTCWYGHATEQ